MKDSNKLDVIKIENRHILTRESAAELGVPNALTLSEEELAAVQSNYDEF